MTIVLWVISALLALAYLAAGAMKLRARRLPSAEGAANVAPRTAVLIGALEVLGAIGLILPWALQVAPVLTPLAALGLVVLQALAIAFHLRHRERTTLPANAVLLVLALVVMIGRFAELGSA